MNFSNNGGKNYRYKECSTNNEECSTMSKKTDWEQFAKPSELTVTDILTLPCTDMLCVQPCRLSQWSLYKTEITVFIHSRILALGGGKIMQIYNSQDICVPQKTLLNASTSYFIHQDTNHITAYILSTVKHGSSFSKFNG